MSQLPFAPPGPMDRLRQLGLDWPAAWLFLRLSGFVSRKDQVTASRAKLASWLRCSPVTVKRAEEQLRDAGLVTWEVRRGAGRTLAFTDLGRDVLRTPVPDSGHTRPGSSVTKVANDDGSDPTVVTPEHGPRSRATNKRKPERKPVGGDWEGSDGSGLERLLAELERAGVAALPKCRDILAQQLAKVTAAGVAESDAMHTLEELVSGAIERGGPGLTVRIVEHDIPREIDLRLSRVAGPS